MSLARRAVGLPAMGSRLAEIRSLRGPLRLRRRSRRSALEVTEGRQPIDSTSTYICDYCGEENSILIDPSGGSSQEFVEDCPVCCRAHVLHVELFEDGEVRLWSEPEQDHQ